MCVYIYILDLELKGILQNEQSNGTTYTIHMVDLIHYIFIHLDQNQQPAETKTCIKVENMCIK